MNNNLAPRLAEKIQAADARRWNDDGGPLSIGELASIIRTELAEALPDLIEPPRRFNWARQNYCSGWNQCIHAMRKRLGVTR